MFKRAPTSTKRTRTRRRVTRVLRETFNSERCSSLSLGAERKIRSIASIIETIIKWSTSRKATTQSKELDERTGIQCSRLWESKMPNDYLARRTDRSSIASSIDPRSNFIRDREENPIRVACTASSSDLRIAFSYLSLFFILFFIFNHSIIFIHIFLCLCIYI